MHEMIEILALNQEQIESAKERTTEELKLYKTNTVKDDTFTGFIKKQLIKIMDI